MLLKSEKLSFLLDFPFFLAVTHSLSLSAHYNLFGNILPCAFLSLSYSIFKCVCENTGKARNSIRTFHTFTKHFRNFHFLPFRLIAPSEIQSLWVPLQSFIIFFILLIIFSTTTYHATVVAVVIWALDWFDFWLWIIFRHTLLNFHELFG